jgi:hypothetical protein
MNQDHGATSILTAEQIAEIIRRACAILGYAQDPEPEQPASFVEGEPVAPPTTSTQRSREARARKRAGLRRVAVDVREEEVAMLVDFGLVTADELDDANAVGKALAHVFRQGFLVLDAGVPLGSREE